MEDEPRILGDLDPRARYEAAWVVALAHPAAGRIVSLRQALGLAAPVQLLPHLTLLFIGRGSGAQLEGLRHVLAEIAETCPAFVLDSWGTFGADRRVANLHLRPAAGPFAALHSDALARCEAAGWANPSAFTGARYTPHVSVYDGLDHVLPPALPPVVIPVPPSPCVVIGRRVPGGPT